MIKKKKYYAHKRYNEAFIGKIIKVYMNAIVN